MPVSPRAGSQLLFPSAKLSAPQRPNFSSSKARHHRARARAPSSPLRQAHTITPAPLFVDTPVILSCRPIACSFSTRDRLRLLRTTLNSPSIGTGASITSHNRARRFSKLLLLTGVPSYTRHRQATSPCIAARYYHANPAKMTSHQQVPIAPAGMDHLVSQIDGLSLQALSEKYPSIHPDRNPMDLYRAHIADVLSPISGVAPDIILSAIQWTSTLDKGDCVIAVPALRIRDKSKKPDQLAQQWAAAFPDDDPLVHKPTASSYFVSFFLRGGALVKAVVPMIRAMGAEYGRNPASGLRDAKDPSKGRKRVVIEFSSPNIAKQFHVGHLRSTIIGGYLANLYEACGWEVLRFNYLGDWGKQYGLMALGWEKFGVEEELQRNPIDHLFHLYVRINKEKDADAARIEAARAEGKDVTALEAESLDEQARRYFKKMTERDESALTLWRRFRELSVAKYEETYARLNIRFDEYRGESLVPEESMEKRANEMAEKGISKEDQGAVLVDFTDHVPGKEGKRLEKAVVRKRDGTALYLTRDISELLNRYDEYHFDQMIYVVASQQDLHLKQLFKIVELLGYKDIAARCQHINFGLVHGMSTRRGTVKFLDDILNDVGQFMHENMRKNEAKYKQVEDPEATADVLGISAVMCQDMTGKRVNGYHFNMEAMTSFEGDTGPYLQYAHARLRSIERKAALSGAELDAADLSLLTERHAVDVVRMLAQWPDVVQTALKTLEPTTILTYLFKMAHVVSSSYDVLQVVGSEPELLRARMALYTAARTVLRNGMELLGLTPLERM